MKSKRHQRLLDIIRTNVIETQEQLAEMLATDGIMVTQATISRDIKELRLIKIPIGDGRYKYSVPAERDILDINKRLERLFKDSVANVEDSENIVVIKTAKGAAQGVAAIMDDLEWPEVLGSIAGDDTIFLVIKPADQVTTVMARLNKLRN